MISSTPSYAMLRRVLIGWLGRRAGLLGSAPEK
jgi:hypothetical protein